MNKRRLISASRSEIHRMNAMELKHAIRASEGRVILAQNFVAHTTGLVTGATNAELCQAFGADMVFFNGYTMDTTKPIPGLMVEEYDENNECYAEKQYRLNDMKKLIDLPLGIYLECGLADDASTSTAPGGSLIRQDRIASEENLNKIKEEKADFVVLAGNPGTGVKIQNVIEATKRAKAILGDDVLIFAGKWEDGVYDKVIGDPLAERPAKEVIKDLIDAGADVICLPMPGSRTGITVDMIRECVEFTHSYKEGTLTMSFLDGSVEGADEATVRACTLMSKQTGSDIHAIGDAGLGGTCIPEDLYQMSMTTKGRRLTFRRMASTRR